MSDGQVAARRHGGQQLLHDRTRLIVIADERQDAEHGDSHGSAEIQCGRSALDNGGDVAGVSLKVGCGSLRAARQQRPSVDQHERIVVDIDDPRLGRDPLGDFMRVINCRQPGPDIEELADSRVSRQVPHRAHKEPPGRERDIHDLGQHGESLITGLPVDGVVVLAAQPVIPDPGRMRHRSVDAGWRCVIVARVACHGESHLLLRGRLL